MSLHGDNNNTAPLLAQNPHLPRALDINPSERGIWALLWQHFSNTWGTRMAEFAVHLYLIVYYKNTLLPNALYGFSACVTNILFAQWLGSLVDTVPKLPLVRGCVIVQKLSAFIAYGVFIAMFFWAGAEHDTPSWAPALDFPALGLITFAGAVLQASTTCITIAVERDWATCIAEGSSDMLSSLNARLKRIDLLCKLLAPLFVSALSTFMPYLWAAVIMATFQLLSFVVELFWLGVVYRSCPALARDQARKDNRRPSTNEDGEGAPLEGVPCVPCLNVCNRNKRYWSEFARLPIFLSSLSASFLYMTVLSFDGTMLSYLKSQGYSDAMLSIMRGMNVLTGLAGTVLGPWLEQRLGSVRSGSWSIWSEVVCLVPVIVALQSSRNKTELGVAMLLFGGMAFSRIGLWSFDLIQIKQLQVSLEGHPERNTLTSLQLSLQNTADLIKYILVMVFWRPSEFKWTALLSFISVLSGAATYSVYVRQERGHLFHLDRLWRKIRSV